MGKSGKKIRNRNRNPHQHQQHEDQLPSSAYDLPSSDQNHQIDEDEDEEEDEEEESPKGSVDDISSKYQLYEEAVQSPKGDITYLCKFFLLYVGGRNPLHLQEDFSGTALLSSHWIRSDPLRTAVAVDFDLDALTYSLNHHHSSRLFLFHGDVLEDPTHRKPLQISHQPLPERDVVCAFNYSCCCLLQRSDLVSYFRFARAALSGDGGIFVMDVYGGSSSEHSLKLKRTYSNFNYVWEQSHFDVLTRKTRISLHFKLRNNHVIRHAFSYDWRLWSLPEIRDCLEEAGFQSVHFWIREMPDTHDSHNAEEFRAGSDVKYVECSSFEQRDAWNAYIVAVSKPKVDQ